MFSSQAVVLGTAPFIHREESDMEYEERLKRLDEHLAEHPTDYQARIARLKVFSDSVEHKQYLKRIERMKLLERYKREYGSK